MPERAVIQVPIGGIATARNPGVLTTLLGSCVGLVLQDLRNQLAALAHVVRPNGKGAGMGPGYFADQAAANARDLLLQAGADPRHLLARLAGGGRMVRTGVDIGARNAVALKEECYRLGMTFGGHVDGPVDGGCFLVVETATGKVSVRPLAVAGADDGAWRQLRQDLEGPK
jgi:chemotaxis protein CheD